MLSYQDQEFVRQLTTTLEAYQKEDPVLTRQVLKKALNVQTLEAKTLTDARLIDQIKDSEQLAFMERRNVARNVAEKLVEGGVVEERSGSRDDYTIERTYRLEIVPPAK